MLGSHGGVPTWVSKIPLSTGSGTYKQDSFIKQPAQAIRPRPYSRDTVRLDWDHL